MYRLLIFNRGQVYMCCIDEMMMIRPIGPSPRATKSELNRIDTCNIINSSLPQSIILNPYLSFSWAPNKYKHKAQRWNYAQFFPRPKDRGGILNVNPFILNIHWTKKKAVGGEWKRKKRNGREGETRTHTPSSNLHWRAYIIITVKCDQHTFEMFKSQIKSEERREQEKKECKRNKNLIRVSKLEQIYSV